MRVLPNSGARRRRRGEAVPTLQREGIDLLALLPEREGTCRQHSSFFSQLRVSLFGPGLYLATRHDQASGRCGPVSTEKQMRKSRKNVILDKKRSLSQSYKRESNTPQWPINKRNEAMRRRPLTRTSHFRQLGIEAQSGSSSLPLRSENF